MTVSKPVAWASLGALAVLLIGSSASPVDGLVVELAVLIGLAGVLLVALRSRSAGLKLIGFSIVLIGVTELAAWASAELTKLVAGR